MGAQQLGLPQPGRQLCWIASFGSLLHVGYENRQVRLRQFVEVLHHSMACGPTQQPPVCSTTTAQSVPSQR